MARRARDEDDDDLGPRSRAATTPEGREHQLINMAYDLVEERIRNKSATSQETTFFLKAGSPREKLERERLENENAVLKKKVEAMEAQIGLSSLIEDALNAFQSYESSARRPDFEIED